MEARLLRVVVPRRPPVAPDHPPQEVVLPRQVAVAVPPEAAAAVPLGATVADRLRLVPPVAVPTLPLREAMTQGVEAGVPEAADHLFTFEIANTRACGGPEEDFRTAT